MGSEWVYPKWNNDPTGMTVFSKCGQQTNLLRRDPKTGAQWCAAWGAGRVSAAAEYPPRRGEFYERKYNRFGAAAGRGGPRDAVTLEQCFQKFTKASERARARASRRAAARVSRVSRD